MHLIHQLWLTALVRVRVKKAVLGHNWTCYRRSANDWVINIVLVCEIDRVVPRLKGPIVAATTLILLLMKSFSKSRMMLSLSHGLLLSEVTLSLRTNVAYVLLGRFHIALFVF